MSTRGLKLTEGGSHCLPPPKLCLMESTFSSPAEAALQREAGSAGLRTSLGDLDRVYELERVVGFVRDLGCQRVRARWGAEGSARGLGSWGSFVRLGMG